MADNRLLLDQDKKPTYTYGTTPQYSGDEISFTNQLQYPQDAFYGTKFRFIIGGLLLVCVTMAFYAHETLFISAIEMISSDVLSSGVTKLRAKHQASLDWLQVPKISHRAYQDNTCPIEVPNYQNDGSKWIKGLVKNVSLILKIDAAALAHDQLALVDDVDYRLSTGKLVDWTIEQRGLIFSAARIGNLLAALPLSRLGLQYGSKHIVSLGVFTCALHCLLLPLVAGHMPFWFTLTFEFICGCFSCAMIHVAFPLVACWFLPHEASAIVALMNVCILVGGTLNNIISSQMLAKQIPWSWLFYLAGCVNLILWIAWMILGADQPEKSRFVTRQEMIILEKSVVKSQREVSSRLNDETDTFDEKCLCGKFEMDCPAKNVKRVPVWTKLATCPTVYTLIVVNFAGQWVNSSGSLLPTYFANIQHLDAATIGLIISLKGFCCLIYGTLFAYYTRKLAINRPFGMSLTAFRRSAQLLATLIEVIRLMLSVFLDCNMTAIVASQVIMTISSNFDVISFHQMPLDLSPEDSGLLASWIRLFSVGDALSNPVAGWIITATTSPGLPNGDRHSWRLVWLTCVIIKLIACVCFVAFAKAEPKAYSRLKPAGVCKSRLLLRQLHEEETTGLADSIENNRIWFHTRGKKKI